MTELDRRLHAYRSDLADARLRGRVEAAEYTEGSRRRLRAPIAGLYREPRFDAMQMTQVLLGESVRLFDAREGWAWVQCENDGYVGYLSEDVLDEASGEPTHRVAVPSSLMFQAPDIKSQPVTSLPMNARLEVTGIEGRFASLVNGQFAIAGHLLPIAGHAADFVGVAEQFLHVPYLWGGKSVAGIDCSGLVQISLEAAGVKCPRDSDMQEEQLGHALPVNGRENLRRGDLIFWKSHVGIMKDEVQLLHANAQHMMVVAEPLSDAVARIASQGSEVTAIRRLQ
jgi:cell wall-associated NlpC family hydrolase